MKHETDYWKKRQEQLFLQGEKSIKEYYKELKKAFTIAQNEIKLQLFEFYSQYAKENGVSFVEAQKRLSQTELKGLQEYIERVQQTMGTYDLTLSNMSIKARVTRLEALQMQIDAILQELYATSYEQKGKEVLTNIYEDNYNQLWYHSDRYLGIHQEFAHINPRDVEQVISYPFNGQNFSQRLWKQKDFLQMKLNECLTHSLILGTEPSKLAKDFATHFERREYEAYRLLHTETSYVLEQSTLAGYKESGVEYYKILATLDQKTSDICKKQDGKVYAVSEAVVGVNYPPFHIFCRTTTVPEYEDVPAEGFRMARGEDGKPMKVPADMTYLEWEKKYLKCFSHKEMGARTALEWLERDSKAEDYYDSVRNRKDDIVKIAKNTGFSEDDIRKIKEHVFFSNHVLCKGIGRFDADYDMAVSWQRLINGSFEDRDLILLNHELLESTVEKCYNLTYKEAHEIAEKKYPWSRITDEILGGDRENANLDELIRKERE